MYQLKSAQFLGSITNHLYRLSDLFFLVASAYLGFFLYLHGNPAATLEKYHAPILLGAFVVLTTLRNAGLYRVPRGSLATSYMGRFLNAFLIGFAMLATFAVITKTTESYSRGWFVLWFVMSLTLAFVGRLVVSSLAHWYHANHNNDQRILIVGEGTLAQRVAAKFVTQRNLGFKVVGFVDAGCSSKRNKHTVAIPTLGKFEEINALIMRHSIQQVWVAVSYNDMAVIEQLRSVLESSTVQVRFVPDQPSFHIYSQTPAEIGGMNVITLNGSPMNSGINRIIKCIEDRVLAAIILLLISPLMLLIAAAVKLTSPGPVFYRQERIGWNGKAFGMLKFRSMAVDAEAAGVQWGGARTMSLTPIGAFLRSTSLDELPQFLNVLTGDMSIVGPRPERTQFVNQFKTQIPGYMQKHLVKGGITGLAQISGLRGDTDLGERVVKDLEYIQNWSVWLDLKIIVLTIFKGFINKNAG